MTLFVIFYPYHFVYTILFNTILSVYHFVHTILSVPFCLLPFCPKTVFLSTPSSSFSSSFFLIPNPHRMQSSSLPHFIPVFCHPHPRPPHPRDHHPLPCFRSTPPPPISLPPLLPLILFSPPHSFLFIHLIFLLSLPLLLSPPSPLDPVLPLLLPSSPSPP